MSEERYPSLPWYEATESVERITFRVVAGDALGTGFLVSVGNKLGSTEQHLLVATAWHVVEGVVGNDKPLWFESAAGDFTIGKDGGQCKIFPVGDTENDAALIMIKTEDKIFDRTSLRPLFPEDCQLRRGTEIGCVGFPGLVHPELCFFKGSVAGTLTRPPAYLVDGVVVNGVSGGPAFDDKAQLIGMVSAYLPNRVDEVTVLPGLSLLIPMNLIRVWIEEVLGPTVL